MPPCTDLEGRRTHLRCFDRRTLTTYPWLLSTSFLPPWIFLTDSSFGNFARKRDKFWFGWVPKGYDISATQCLLVLHVKSQLLLRTVRRETVFDYLQKSLIISSPPSPPPPFHSSVLQTLPSFALPTQSCRPPFRFYSAPVMYKRSRFSLFHSDSFRFSSVQLVLHSISFSVQLKRTLSSLCSFPFQKGCTIGTVVQSLGYFAFFPR